MSDNITDALWYSGTMDFLLHETQLDVYKKIIASPHQTHLVFCSRQWGKSHLSQALGYNHIANYIANNKRPLVKLAAGTLKAARDIVSDNMKIFTETAPRGYIIPQKSEYRWRVGPGEFRLGMLEQSNVDSLRGGNATQFVLDEAAAAVTSDDFKYALRSVIGPQLLRSGGKLIIPTTPSKDPDHYVHTDIMEECKRNGTFYKYTIYDNPQLTTEQIYQAIALCGGADTIDFRREYMCEIVRDGRSLVIPAFSELRHVTNDGYESVYQSSCWLSIDVGGIRDRTMIQVFGTRISDGHPIIFDECFFSNNTSTLEIGRQIIEFVQKYQIAPHHIWMDAHGQTQVDLFKWCNIMAPLPPKQDRDAAIGAVNSAFFLDQLFVSKKCEVTIKSFRSCMFNERRTDFERTEELGHADAIMSAVYGYRVAGFVEKPRILTNSGGTWNQLFAKQQSDSLYAEINKKLSPARVVWKSNI